MDELAIRVARRDDLLAVVRLLVEDEVQGAREVLSDPPAECYAAAFDAIAVDPNHTLFVAERSGQVVGTLQLSFIPNMTCRGGWRAQIEGVMVSVEHRNEGIGGAMVEFAIARARERHSCLVQLTSDKRRTRALRFYERHGFAFTHEGAKLSLYVR